MCPKLSETFLYLLFIINYINTLTHVWICQTVDENMMISKKKKQHVCNTIQNICKIWPKIEHKSANQHLKIDPKAAMDSSKGSHKG